MSTHEIRQHEHTDPVTGQKFLVTDEVVDLDEEEWDRLKKAMNENSEFWNRLLNHRCYGQ